MTTAPAPADLRRRLGGLMLRDERRLRRRLDRARRRDGERRDAALAALAEEVASAERRRARREAAVPTVRYPPELPISAARDELAEALSAHQVVVVAGETGSGKTTQLPKLCLELGRGVRGTIGHTQPRRLAARSVATRIAAELEVALGGAVGYQVRFTDTTSEDTLVKLMTDGVLLAETRHDPALRAYDTIIIDEAHERSLNIDFLLGYLTQLLPRRPDLKVIITSATIDTARFAEHFDAPVVEVSGRTYPVEVRYRPFEDDDRDQAEAIVDAVAELAAEGPGDALVFLPGERDIREAADALRRAEPGVEVLPLYARLSPAQQQRVFEPHRGRRVVLATNVAETSLTVPGIRYVVDVGTARISRYSQRTKVQRLPIEKVSQASARQRAGRCGRLADGICIRLYDEGDHDARPAYTEPEILRTNLASVILQMTDLGLGDVAAFPFLDPPDRRSVRAAVGLLHELGAIDRPAVDGSQQLTDIGRILARLPVDPRLGRMIVAADAEGALSEVLVIAAALSSQDPRLRPPEQEHAADASHERFADPSSDFLTLLALWRYLTEQRRSQSSGAFRRRCKAEFLHHLRVREWQDLHGQLREAAKEVGLSRSPAPAEPAQIHRAVLAGLLSQIGVQPTDGRDYEGARGTRFVLWPGTAVEGRPPWVMAAELVETSRLFARTVAAIDPAWAEELAGHLVDRHYGEPRWDARRGVAVVEEKVTLYGVTLVADRTVPYHRVDRAGARELLLRHGLVEGDVDHPVVTANRRLLDELADLEDRARRRDLVADPEQLLALYDARVPDHVVSAAHFASWWKAARAEQPDLLAFTAEDLLNAEAPALAEGTFPDTWRHDDLTFGLSYRFAPGEPDDGVTVEVPLAALSRLPSWAFDRQVPGLRAELVTALVRGLPKAVRRELVPIPETVERVLARLTPTPEPLVDALVRELRRDGVDVDPEAFDVASLPAHLRMRIRVVHDGTILAEGEDLPALQAELAGEARSVVAGLAEGLETTGATSWTFGTLPPVVELAGEGGVLRGYPALVDEGESVGVQVLSTPQEQRQAMWRGTRRLLRLSAPLPTRVLQGSLSREDKLALSRNPHGSVGALLEDAAACAVDALMASAGGPARDADGFAALRETVASGLTDAVLAILGDVRRVLDAAATVEPWLARLDGGDLADSVADARAHLARLVGPGFIARTGRERLGDLPRYLEAIAVRLDKLPRAPGRDLELTARVTAVERAYTDLVRRVGPRAVPIRWMLEELRVSLFAQQLGTRQRVSEQRVLRAIEEASRR